MLDPITDPALRQTLPLAREALLPPPPKPPARGVHLEELARLISELEAWRRAQTARLAQRPLSASAEPALPPPPPVPREGARWLFVRAPSGATVRVRFEAGRPSQLRTSAHDRDAALAAVASALDLPLACRGPWRRDAVMLDWVVAVAPIQ
ncbi:MAG: hypothetical protein VYE22_31125 [Myxococcota bacterium]|nr:hypothetical protein [Myxococcota bacterium]